MTMHAAEAPDDGAERGELDDGALIIQFRIERAGSSTPEEMRQFARAHNAFLRWLQGQAHSLRDVDERDVSAWLVDQSRSHGVRQRQLAYLAELFVWMRDEGMRDDVPTARVNGSGSDLIRSQQRRSAPRDPTVIPTPAGGVAAESARIAPIGVGARDRALLDEYARRQRARGLSDDTRRAYSWIFQACAAHLHERGLTLLTAQRDDLEEWVSLPILGRDGVVQRPRCNRTRAIYANRLGLLFEWLQDEGHRADLPTRGIANAKVPRAVPRPIATDGLYRAIDLADERLALMISLAAFAGLRRGEIAKIDRADIHFELDPAVLLVHGKGNKERVIPIGPVVAAAFARYGLPDHGPIFTGHGDVRISREYVGKLISGHLRSCGVDATAHQGRHWFISTLYEGTRDLRLCQEMAGHANPSTTAGYAAWNPTRAAAAINALPASRPTPSLDSDRQELSQVAVPPV